jgi:phenol hydroxylase P3 protein
MVFTEVETDPMQISYRVTEHGGDKYHFCSDGCKDIFEFEPEKYVQAWLPVHQIFQGNCGGPTIPDVLDWYKFKPEDSGDYIGSQDHARWQEWKGEKPKVQEA